MLRLLLSLIMLLAVPSLQAANVQSVRIWSAPDHTRLVFDVDRAVEHQVFTLQNPERLVIDLPTSRIASGFDSSGVANRHIKRLRYAVQQDNSLRLVLDLKDKVKPKTFVLRPNSDYGHRLVIDLLDSQGQVRSRVAKSEADIAKNRDVVIAIDAGHGGEDPGASGSVSGTQEKAVTLQIAQRLKRLIDARPGMRGVLTRTGDYYIGLRKRMALARSHRADLFISIHADAFRDSRVRGSSVYVLSSRGATSEAARWLAEKENAADLVGGVSLDDKDDMLASVLLDLSQTATQEASLSAARRVYGKLKRIGKVHGRQVQQAGFMVLKSPDIPSMLVETGFISNPVEERNLRNPDYQERLAKSLAEGVERYFRDAPPPGTLLAKQERDSRPSQYRIVAGDTLSQIAQRYQVSLADLRAENRIKNDNRIRVGQILRIPGG